MLGFFHSDSSQSYSSDVAHKSILTMEKSVEKKETSQQKEETSDKVSQPQKQQSSNQQPQSQQSQQSQKEETTSDVSSPIEKKEEVTLTILGINKTIGQENVEIEDGDSVFSVLKRYTTKHQISMKTSGYGSMIYVRGIGDLVEHEHGAGSGWVYKVNGASPNISAGNYEVSQGDVIVWEYIYSE